MQRKQSLLVPQNVFAVITSGEGKIGGMRSGNFAFPCFHFFMRVYVLPEEIDSSAVSQKGNFRDIHVGKVLSNGVNIY